MLRTYSVLRTMLGTHLGANGARPANRGGPAPHLAHLKRFKPRERVERVPRFTAHTLELYSNCGDHLQFASC